MEDFERVQILKQALKFATLKYGALLGVSSKVFRKYKTRLAEQGISGETVKLHIGSLDRREKECLKEISYVASLVQEVEDKSRRLTNQAKVIEDKCNKIARLEDRIRELIKQ